MDTPKMIFTIGLLVALLSVGTMLNGTEPAIRRPLPQVSVSVETAAEK
jgi:hypothetical protein